MAVLPFVVCNGLQALPHLMSIGAGVLRFDLSPVLMLCLFDGSLEGIAGVIIRYRKSRSLKAAALPFSSVQMLHVIHGFWLGYVLTVTVGTTSSMHLLIYSSMPSEESRNIFQSVQAKQSCSLASASSDHFCKHGKRESGG